MPRLHVRAGRTFLVAMLLMVATAGIALSAEGFFTDDRPPAVRAAWGSVYAFVCEGRGDNYTATAFLIGRGAGGKSTDYFFITAGHAIEDCRQPRRYLVDNINQPRFESDGITLAARPPRLSDIALVYAALRLRPGHRG
jgi:hypothetical protein